MSNVLGQTIRVRLVAEVVVYRIEQVYQGRDEDGDNWEDLQSDVTGEFLIDQATILTGDSAAVAHGA